MKNQKSPFPVLDGMASGSYSERECAECRAPFIVDMDMVRRARRESRRGPSEIWCRPCDDERIARITRSLDALIANKS